MEGEQPDQDKKDDLKIPLVNHERPIVVLCDENCKQNCIDYSVSFCMIIFLIALILIFINGAYWALEGKYFFKN